MTLTQTLRLVAPLAAEERYRRLKAWTFPTADRKSIRWLIQAFGEVRLPNPFASPKAVADRGVVGTPILLIDAARELGKLDELAAELKPLSDAKVENAPRLLALVELARGVGKDALPILKGRHEELGNKPKLESDGFGNSRNGQVVDTADYLLAREALASSVPELNAIGEELASRLDSMGQSYSGLWVIGRTRRDLAEDRARKAGAPTAASSTDPGLALWSPRHVSTFVPEGDARERALWAESEGVVGHIAGNGANDFLLSRIPLTGTFEFSVDAYSGSYAEATVGYGGLIAEPTGFNTQSGIHNLGYGDRVARPGIFARYDAFNRITIRVSPGKVSYLVNGHLFYEDTKATTTSPWLTLNAASQRHTAFKNATLTGRPEIPHEVPLAGGDGLDGWDSSTYYETTPSRRAAVEPNPINRRAQVSTKPVEPDWRAVDGEIRGRRVDPSTSNAFNPNYLSASIALDNSAGNPVMPSRLAYVRPMGDGDSIAYEFFYQAGETMVHPAVGHLAFLIEPEGVRLHALVPPGEGVGDVGPGNVLDDPTGRRDAVVLKPGDWNAAVVRLKGCTLSLEVNGTLVSRAGPRPRR